MWCQYKPGKPYLWPVWKIFPQSLWYASSYKSLDSPVPCAIRGSTTYGILGDIFLATTAPWKGRVKHAAKHLTTSNSLWPNTSQVHLIPVIRPQIAWLQDKHENLFTRRKAYPEGSARRKLWLSRVNKSACVWTLPCYNCFIILNQQDREKKSLFIQINFAKAVHLMTSQT
jgi:hypothetical protein